MDKYLKTADTDWYKQRIIGVILVVSVCLTVLLVRLFFLQIIKGAEYRRLSENNSIRLQRIEPFRGADFGKSQNGIVTWLTGANSGQKMEVKKYTIGAIELFQPMPYTISIGDTYTVTAGCDKQLSTCRDRFANVANFRGEPHLPGNDALMKHA